MTTQNVTVTVAAATYDAIGAVADFVATAKKAVADGWTPGTDIPAIVLAAIHDIGKVVAEVGDIQAEAAGEKAPLVTALTLGGAKIVAALTN